MNKRDTEIDIMRRQAGLTALDCADFLNISYSSFCQRIGGFCNWQGEERERLIDYINRRKTDNESDM